MSPSGLLAWLRKARSGQVLAYHTGFLSNDRAVDPKLDKLANALAKAQEVGKVRLYQFRIVTGQYVYLAQRVEPTYEPTIGEQVAAIQSKRREAEKAYRRA